MCSSAAPEAVAAAAIKGDICTIQFQLATYSLFKATRRGIVAELWAVILVKQTHPNMADGCDDQGRQAASAW